jgi:hypothetical protein
MKIGSAKKSPAKVGFNALVFLPPFIPIVHSRIEHANVRGGANASHIDHQQRQNGNYAFEANHTAPCMCM